jgi:AraC-like DNA-binding protein
MYYAWSTAEQPDQSWSLPLSAVFEPAGNDEGNGTHRICAGRRAVIAASTCGPIRLVRRPLAIEGRILDQLGFRLVQAGTSEYVTSKGAALVRTGDFQVIDLQKPSQFSCLIESDTFAEVTLWLPRARLQSLIGREYDLHGSVFKAESPAVRVLASVLKSVSEENQRLTASLLDDLSDGLAALCASATRQSSNLVLAPHDSLAVICRYIESNLGARDLGVDRLVRTFGLSRASVYRLFEPLDGVAKYIRSRRLERAHQYLCAASLDNRRIAPIAYRVGFRSMAAFNRAYQEAYACTPRETRAMRAAEAEPAKHLARPREIGVLARCLLEMSL